MEHKKTPPRGNGTASIAITKQASQKDVSTVTRPDGAAQSRSAPIDIKHVASLWKSPRNRQQAIQVGLKSFAGHDYCDIRIYEAIGSGFMRPSSKGLTVSLQKLPQLAKALGDAHRQAVQLGLTRASS